MKQTINNSQFHSAFYHMDRGNQFSYEALNLIYEFFEQIEDASEQEIELDVIAICCEYSESSVEQIIRDYSIDCDSIEDDEIEAHVLAYLDEHTTVLGLTDDGSIVFAQF
jgi:hypothetical protein